MKVKDEDGITVVNSARTQMTYADLVLAEEEYARKKALAAEAKRLAAPSAKRTTASSIAARMDREENIRQIKKILTDPLLKAEDRNALERKLEDEQMAQAFSPRH